MNNRIDKENSDMLNKLCKTQIHLVHENSFFVIFDTRIKHEILYVINLIIIIMLVVSEQDISVGN